VSTRLLSRPSGGNRPSFRQPMVKRRSGLLV
jgi:hypothetical protein